MKKIADVRNWIQKHWQVLRHRPTNGHTSMGDLDETLKEMHGNTQRVCTAVEEIMVETRKAKRMMKENAVSSDHS